MAKEKPQITLAIFNHPRFRALVEGKVVIEGYNLDFRHDFGDPGEQHHRFEKGEYDIGEFSTANFLRTKEREDRFVALPVFGRSARQRSIFYREGTLKHPTELKGKKIGCFRYGATSVVWARGFLLDEYGLRTPDMTWYVSGQENYTGMELPVKVERLDPPAPFGEEANHLLRYVSEGKLHAAIIPGDTGYVGIFGGGSLAREEGKFPGVKPLFDSTEEIIRYITEKRIYPITNLLALKREVAERYPDLPAKLLWAFREAKKYSSQYMAPEENTGYEKEKEVLGEDPYACVVGETEKRTLRTLMRYQLEQGLMKKELPIETLFIPDAFHL